MGSTITPFGMYFSMQSTKILYDMFALKSDIALEKYFYTIKKVVFVKLLFVYPRINFNVQKKKIKKKMLSSHI